VSGADCKTKFPVMLVHGTGFRDLKMPLYWGRIPSALKANGAAVYYGLQDSWGSTESNTEALRKRVDEVLNETGAEKINLIGHSKGGLEIRMLAALPGTAGRIASVTTIATPHHGSKTVDRLLRAPDVFFRLAAFALNNWIRLVGDTKPDFIAVCRGFSTEQMEIFNKKYRDADGVFYQSFGFYMPSPFSDVNLSTANFIIGLVEGMNDGLVTVESARWGDNFTLLHPAGRRGISHLDEIDFRRRPLSARAVENTVCDIVDVYTGIVSNLREKGF